MYAIGSNSLQDKTEHDECGQTQRDEISDSETSDSSEMSGFDDTV